MEVLSCRVEPTMSSCRGLARQRLTSIRAGWESAVVSEETEARNSVARVLYLDALE